MSTGNEARNKIPLTLENIWCPVGDIKGNGNTGVWGGGEAVGWGSLQEGGEGRTEFPWIMVAGTKDKQISFPTLHIILQ